MLTRRGTAAFTLAVALGLGGCGGGGKSSTTTSAPAGGDSTTSALPTTTTAAVDPALRDLLLVAADLPAFTEKAGDAGPQAFFTCDPAEARAVKAILDEPKVDGARFVRGAKDEVAVASTVSSTTPEKAEAALTELLDAKLARCFEAETRSNIEKTAAAGSEITVKTTAAKSKVDGTEQTMLVSSTVTVKSGAKTESSRLDLVFLRRQGAIVTISYGGPSGVTTVAERQRIVAAVSKKLVATSSGSSTTAGSSTSTAGGSSTSRRSSTTRRSSTSSMKSTTSSSQP